MKTSIAPLSGAKDWAGATHRPVLIVGNGPSCADFDPKLLPDDAVIIRINNFFLESRYDFGRRVDGLFWAISRRWMQVAFKALTDLDQYDIGTYFLPHDVSVPSLPFLALESAEAARQMYPRLSQFDIVQQNPKLGEYVGANRKRKGLPTQGVVAVATMLMMGFKEIYTIGLDFYQSTDRRYHFEFPKFLPDISAPIHLEPGYESLYHSLDLELEFFYEALKQSPGANVFTLTSSSYMSKFTLPAQPAAMPFASDAQQKDMVAFNAELENRCFWFNRCADPIVGEVILARPDALLIWAWDRAAPRLKRIVDLYVEGKRVHSLHMNNYFFEFDIGGIGDAQTGTFLRLTELEKIAGGRPVRFVDRFSGRELKGGLFAPFTHAVFNAGSRPVYLEGASARETEQSIAADYVRVLPDVVTEITTGLSTLTPNVDQVNLSARIISEFDAIDEITHELSVLLWLFETYPNRPVRLSGMRFLEGEARSYLRQLMVLYSGTFARLDRAFKSAGVYAEDEATRMALQDVATMMNPVTYLYDDAGISAVSAHKRIAKLAKSKAHNAIRLIALSTWPVGGHHAIGRSEKGPLLIDGSIIAGVTSPFFDVLLDRTGNADKKIFFDSIRKNEISRLLERLGRLGDSTSIVMPSAVGVQMLRQVLPQAKIAFDHARAIAMRRALTASLKPFAPVRDKPLRVAILGGRSLFSGSFADTELKLRPLLLLAGKLSIDIISGEFDSQPYQMALTSQVQWLNGFKGQLEGNYDLVIVDDDDFGVSAFTQAVLSHAEAVVTTMSSGVSEYMPVEGMYENAMAALEALVALKPLQVVGQADLNNLASIEDDGDMLGRQYEIEPWETMNIPLSYDNLEILFAASEPGFRLVQKTPEQGLQIHPFDERPTQVRIGQAIPAKKAFKLFAVIGLMHHMSNPVDMAVVCLPRDVKFDPAMVDVAGDGSVFHSGWQTLEALESRGISMDIHMEKAVPMDIVLMAKPTDPEAGYSFMWATCKELIMVTEKLGAAA